MSKNKVKSEVEEPLDGAENAVEQTAEETQNESTSTEETIAEDTDLQGQLQQERDKYLRLYSEFENFRRRTTKDRLDWMQTASKDVLVRLETRRELASIQIVTALAKTHVLVGEFPAWILC